MIILIGTGISFDLTLSAIESLKSCAEAYIETYTNPMDAKYIEKLEEIIGKKVNLLPRSDVESQFLIEKAKSADICLLASGDPLTATTHITLVLDAKEKKIPVKVIHNSSIYSAAPARAGLQTL